MVMPEKTESACCDKSCQLRLSPVFLPSVVVD